ncbi:MAG: lytic transglycosylase domain-containing protein [Rhodanobacteraceae bacterium]|nr:lytic transglycosylase domain-containing protein [Rhodanobacteraceae bacterium]
MAFRLLVPLVAVMACSLPSVAGARTVYRCVRDGTVSLATAPEPGSRCVAHELDDDSPILPNLWGALGQVHGTLYRREQDGRTVYGTRNLPGSTPLFAFAVRTPEASPAHVGLGHIGRPRLDAFPRQFRDAARATGVDEAWLRAIAHAESAYDAGAVSPKGAQGVMQLMPQVSGDYGVADPFSPRESILAGARHLKALLAYYDGDLALVAAAYNAGTGAVAQYGGVPPYAETQQYVAKVQALYARYRAALGEPPRPLRLQAAQ